MVGQLMLPKGQQVEPAVMTRPVPAPRSAAKPSLFLSWAGSGIFFWWQLGAVQYLMERYDLTKVPMAGASGGGLAATLAVCGVNPAEVMASAYDMSLEHNIWERPMGLVGVWGSLIEAWLDAMLPADAADRCRGQVDIIVTQLPFFNQLAINDFRDKQDLINVAMASAHVPVLLDGKVTRDCRGATCVDGSFPDFAFGNCELLTRSGDAIIFDYFEDARLVRNGRFDMLSLKEYGELRKIMRLGYRYAHRLHMSGAFDRFDSSKYRFERVRRGALASVGTPDASVDGAAEQGPLLGLA